MTELYTGRLTIRPPSILPTMEKALRPFIDKPPQWRIGRPEPVQDTKEPVLEWAARTKVQVTSPPGWGYRIEDNEDMEEVERETHEERVENPDDPEQFVDVEVIDEILFRSDDGKLRRYILVNKS